jgi:hypothetical protein
MLFIVYRMIGRGAQPEVSYIVLARKECDKDELVDEYVGMIAEAV